MIKDIVVKCLLLSSSLYVYLDGRFYFICCYKSCSSNRIWLSLEINLNFVIVIIFVMIYKMEFFVWVCMWIIIWWWVFDNSVFGWCLFNRFIVCRKIVIVFIKECIYFNWFLGINKFWVWGFGILIVFVDEYCF